MSMQMAKMRGAEKVVVSEPSALRRRMAQELGADAVFDPKEGDALEWVKKEVGIGRYAFNEGGMADVVIEMAGAPSTVVGSLEMVRSLGTVVLAGLPEHPAPIDVTKIIHKHLTIVPVLGGSMADALKFLAAGAVNSKPLISHYFSLDDGQKALDMSTDSGQSIKVMFVVD